MSATLEKRGKTIAPVQRGHNRVDHLHAEPLAARAVDTQKQEHSESKTRTSPVRSRLTGPALGFG